MAFRFDKECEVFRPQEGETIQEVIGLNSGIRFTCAFHLKIIKGSSKQHSLAKITLNPKTSIAKRYHLRVEEIIYVLSGKNIPNHRNYPIKSEVARNW